jgi:hypothetical protein
MVKLTPFTENEIASMAGRWTHYAIVDVLLGDLTVSATNTVQTFTLYTPVANDWLKDVGAIVTEQFQNTADAAYNSTTITVGDTGDIDQFIASQEMNKNGTVVPAGYNTGDALPFTSTAANILAVVITIGSMSGKALTSLNKGRVVVLFNLFRPPSSLTARSTGGAYAATGAQGDL